VERLTALVAAHAHPAPDALILRDLPQRFLVPGLERLEPHAAALEGKGLDVH